MDKEAFKKHRPYAGEAKPSMLRRRIGHDYGSRCVYLVTMTIEGRRPLLGTLVGSPDAPAGSADAPHVVLTPLGERVRQVWMNNESYYKGVTVIATTIMPDHLHGILFFKEDAGVTLGTVIKGFKAGCNKAYRELLGQPQGRRQPQEKRDREHGYLWSPNYNDHILEGGGELQRWKDYLRDNPLRLAIRRAHREYFRVRFDVTVAGRTYAAIGNRFLLNYPQKEAVQCSRSLTPEAVASEVEKLMEMARKGVVLVSPSISDGEKAVMDAALQEHKPLIFLTADGFNEYSRPGNRYYEACAAGLFLMLAPWPHNNRETRLTRAMCLELNAMAKEIAETWSFTSADGTCHRRGDGRCPSARVRRGGR